MGFGGVAEEEVEGGVAGVKFAALTRGAWDGLVMVFHGTGICQL